MTHRFVSRSYKWSCLGAVALTIALAAPATATPANYGLGFAFGEPSGINAKMWLDHDAALVGGLAWSFVEDGATTVYGDYIRHSYGLLNVQTGALPIYYGVGARLQVENTTRFGFRTVVGLNYQFRTSPFDAFVELVPLLDISPDVDMKLNAALGFRYFFQ